ncbi:uncharacterized protein LOC141850865 [Brevipalpus obovatus]|uniref:uncharacterized protein LOC141850865 n=1 Tax=Brevipalpus obovatus TaxID=246614 RepID=UPI003D9F9ADE
MDQNEEMKRLRHEIYKFAMNGLEANKKTKAKESLAISLGAKPRKSSAINYKELMKQRAAEKRVPKDGRR